MGELVSSLQLGVAKAKALLMDFHKSDSDHLLLVINGTLEHYQFLGVTVSSFCVINTTTVLKNAQARLFFLVLLITRTARFCNSIYPEIVFLYCVSSRNQIPCNYAKMARKYGTLTLVHFSQTAHTDM